MASKDLINWYNLMTKEGADLNSNNPFYNAGLEPIGLSAINSNSFDFRTDRPISISFPEKTMAEKYPIHWIHPPNTADYNLQMSPFYEANYYINGYSTPYRRIQVQPSPENPNIFITKDRPGLKDSNNIPYSISVSEYDDTPESRQIFGKPPQSTPYAPSAQNDFRTDLSPLAQAQIQSLRSKGPPQPGATPTATYVVKEGDNLWDIANKLYGNPFMYKQFLPLNPDIKNPDLIHPGQVLRVMPYKG